MIKKPQITEGEWKASEGLIIYDDGLVAFTSNLVRRVDDSVLSGESWLDMRERIEPELEACKLEKLANAKVMAKSKNMLDALIDEYEELDIQTDFSSDPKDDFYVPEYIKSWMKERMYSIKKVLLDAGCTFEEEGHE